MPLLKRIPLFILFFIIALAFIGPLRDTVKNKRIIDGAILAYITVIPLALFAGPIRQITSFHVLIDSSFGLPGLIPLFICKRRITTFENKK